MVHVGLGSGVLLEHQHAARRVAALEGERVTEVACGCGSSVALTDTGRAYSWGFGEMGQLANGKGGDETVPALVNVPEGHAVLDAAGGWAPVERLAAVAVVHGDDALAATVAPLVDVKATRAKLAAGLGDADAAKRAALGDLRAVARSARLADVQALAQAAAKDAMLYPDVAPPGP